MLKYKVMQPPVDFETWEMVMNMYQMHLANLKHAPKETRPVIHPVSLDTS